MFKKTTRRRLEEFLKRYATDKPVLNLGAGGDIYGYRRFFPNVLMVDVDPLRKPDIVADAHNLPFRDQEFEVVLCAEVLEHTRDPQQVISECYRVLKIGGQLILTTRFIYPLHDAPIDYWRFTRPNLMKLFNEFSKVEIEAETREFTTLAVLIERIIFQTKVRGGKITKGLLLVLSRLIIPLDWLITKRFGDIKRTSEVPEIMSSGYYIIAEK
jgi:SAM-dependent methyltransferase